MGRDDRWTLSAGGNYDQEANAAFNPDNGTLKSAQWYGLTGNLFYDLDPKVRLGLRAEWLRDNDGTRTAIFGSPGYRASFYDLTLGATIRARSRLRVRPELRFDWSPQARAFDAQTKNSQVTPAFDVLWEF